MCGVVALATATAGCTPTAGTGLTTTTTIEGEEPADADESAADDDEEEAVEEWPEREGFDEDEADPEPISSSRTDPIDLITDEDPSAFACLGYLGRGPEAVRSPDQSVVESSPDAHRFRASFVDGTTVDIIVHPEVGTAAGAAAEAEKYTAPLGQLPTLLRQGIGRVTIRNGLEVSTAFPGEGIAVQTSDMAFRRAEDRVAETLFHEAVHTSLDAEYAYQRSEEWLAAQEADGRWISSLARQNPDRDDLAETALYAYALIRTPERLPAATRDAVEARVPNRLAFLAEILPTDDPPFAEDQPPAC